MQFIAAILLLAALSGRLVASFEADSACDKNTGVCACSAGYAGPECNRCSAGFYSLEAGLAGERKACKTCGSCYDQWNSTISSLADKSVDIARQTVELSRLVTTSLGLALPTVASLESGESKLSFSKTSVNFDELDRKLDQIQDNIFKKMRLGQRLALTLYGSVSVEADLVVLSFDLNTFEWTSLQLNTNLIKLAYYLADNSNKIRELDHLLSTNYTNELRAICEGLPRGAFKLIQADRNRTRSNLIRTARLRDHFVVRQEEASRDITAKLEVLKTSKCALDALGVKVMDEALASNEIKLSSDRDLLVAIQSDLGMSPGVATSSLLASLQDQVQFTRSLAKEIALKTDDYYLLADRWTAGLNSTGLALDLARVAIQESETMLGELTEKASDLASGTKIAEQHQLIENSTQIMRIYLDKVDAKWTNAHLEMLELGKTRPQSLESGQVRALLNIGRSISADLASKASQVASSNVKIKPEIGEFKLLCEKASSLAKSASQIHENLAKATKSLADSGILIEQAKSVNSKSIDELNLAKSSLALDETKKLFASSQVLLSELGSRVSALSERLAKLHQEAIRHHLHLKQLLSSVSSELATSNSANKKYLAELGSKQDELRVYLAAIEVVGANKSRRQDDAFGQPVEPKQQASSMSPRVPIEFKAAQLGMQKRAADVISDYQLLSSQLLESIRKSQALGPEFQANELVFERQQRILGLLHAELDKTSADIEARLDRQQAC